MIIGGWGVCASTHVLLGLVLHDEEDEELLDVPVEGRGEVCACWVILGVGVD